MASTDGRSGSTPATGTDAAKVRPARTAAAQRTESTDNPSPEALVKDIEQTREDLAETLDAIAERVSPKRVAKRATRKAAATVKENALVAKEAVVSGAAAAKEAVVEATEVAREKVSAATDAGKTKASGSVEAPAPAALIPAEPTPPLSADVPDVVTTGVGSPGALPPVSAVPVPELGVARPGAATSAAPLRTSTPGRVAPPPAPIVKKEYLLAGAVALAIGLLIHHRRSN